MSSTTLLYLLFALNVAICHASSGFLKHTVLVGSASADGFQEALDAVLGCGAEVSVDHLKGIEHDLLPTWRSLPKVDSSRIAWRTLRYLIQRHFMKVSNMRVRGLEPLSHMNESHLGVASVLHHKVPSFTESVSADQSFTLEDAASFTAALERLIFDDIATLEMAYRLVGVSTKQLVTLEQFGDVLDTYVLLSIFGKQMSGLQTILQISYQIIRQEFPAWDAITQFVRGEILAMDFARFRQPLKHLGKGLLANGYSFHDVHGLVEVVSRVVGEFFSEGCFSMRQILFEMDPEHTGRVPLPRFYQKGVDTDMRFGESEEYLRALGVLDESAAWQQKQVIISNYLQSASNCAAVTEHYNLCCPDLCESTLAEIEVAVGHEEASPEEILVIVESMSMPSSEDFDDEQLVQIDRFLRTRLDDVAAAHGGNVRLHSRLFAQWLHYAFPRDCPFPHKAGTTATSGVDEFNGYAEEEDMLGVAFSSNQNFSEPVVNDTSEWMSLWTDEDELLSSYPRVERGRPRVCLILFVLGAALYGSVRTGSFQMFGGTVHVTPL